MRRAIIGTLGLAMLAGLPLPTSAHERERGAQSDDRWLPWIGCWEDTPDSEETGASGLLVCFRYLDDEEGVELTTYDSGELVSREEIRADGTPVMIEEGGCAGERFAQWSSDGHRLFLTSEMRCGEGVARTTRGVMSMLPDRRSWVEIHGVETGEEPFVGARTFGPAAAASLAEIGIQPPEAGIGLAVTTARSHAAQPLSVADLAETVEIGGASVAAALLVERREPFSLDARMARQLAERGVPGEVLDVIVALDNPQRFEIEGSADALRAQMREPEPRQQAARATRQPYGWYGSSWGRYGRAGYGSFFYDPFLYDSFYYDPFYSRRFGSGGFYSPRVVFVGSPTVRDRAVADPQRGYSNGETTGRQAAPSTTRSSGPSSSRTPSRTPSTTRSPNRGSGDSGGSRASPQGGYSSGDSGGGRQARPRSSDNE